MRCAVIRRFGGPDVLELEEHAPPRAENGELLVRVDACGLNILDILTRRGTPGVNVTLPHVPGCDIVGTVVDGLGPGVDAAIGRCVLIEPLLDGGMSGMIGQQRWGGLAELVVVPASNAIMLDARCTSELLSYASLPVAYGTARRMLVERAHLQAHESVMVRGAGGGVGLACVQLALLIGARVIAVSASPAKAERLRELGVGEVLLATADGQSHRVRDVTGGGADVVVDFLGSTTWKDSLRCARAGGRIVACGNSTGPDAETDLRYVWARELTIRGSNGWAHDDLLTLVAAVRSGELHPVVHSVHRLADVAGAMSEIEERRAFGRVIVTPE